ncbi:MAG: histidine kinase [Parasporobacterium sp.]|nr:histidine kinase [Parasporobacterium sp.]
MKKKQYNSFAICYNDAMETKKKHIQLGIFVTITVLAAAFLLFLLLQGSQTYEQVALEGHALYHSDEGMMIREDLAGEWEFYPDVLLYSNESTKSPETSGIPQIQSLTETEREVKYVQVPHKWIGLQRTDAPASGNASYRLILEKTARVQFGNLVLSMQGFLQDYRIYINGERIAERMPSPYGYQLYPLNNVSGDVEIVIELLNSTTGLTICPEISMIGVHISNMDTTRNILFIIITIFIILFVMFLVFSFTPEAKGLRPIVALGFVMSLLFILNVIWGTGYLDGINHALSNSALSVFNVILQIGVIGFGFWTFYHDFPEMLPKKVFQICETINAGALLLYIVGVFLLHWYNGWYLVFLLPAAAWVLWIIMVIRGMLHSEVLCLLQCLIQLVIFMEAAIAFLYMWNPGNKFRLLVMPSAIICVIVVCFMEYYRYQHEALRKTQKLLELEKYVGRTQTALLSSQIQPHFLYNTLLTIQELCRFDPQEASRVIVRFSEYLRHNVDFMNYSELLPFESEEKHIDNFMYIQEVRFQDKLNYSADIQTRDFMIPPLTIQPLIENAVKYGVRGSLEGGYVFLKVYEDGLGVHILVENSGPGFDADHVRTDHSLGNITTRLKTLVNATLTIKSKEGQDGTKIEILIPKKEVKRSAPGNCG